VTVLSQSTIRQPGFDAWSMKYVPGEQRLQGLLARWGMARFDPYGLTKEQLDEAVRFMREEADAAVELPPASPQRPGRARRRPRRSASRSIRTQAPSQARAPDVLSSRARLFLQL